MQILKTATVAALLSLLAVTSAGTAQAGAGAFTMSFRGELISGEVFHPCGADGAGEMVTLHGFVHLTFHFTLPDDFSGNLVTQSNYSAMWGVGQTSGDIYRIAGGGAWVTVYDPGDVVAVETFSDHVLIIGPGQTPNARLHFLVHTTFNTAGEITAYVESDGIECE